LRSKWLARRSCLARSPAMLRAGHDGGGQSCESDHLEPFSLGQDSTPAPFPPFLETAVAVCVIEQPLDGACRRNRLLGSLRYGWLRNARECGRAPSWLHPLFLS